MRWYVIVEGRRTEKRVYASWIGHVFPDVCPVARIEDMAENRYFMIAGNGYPSYVRRIESAIADIREQDAAFDHLLIAVDAEHLPIAQRRAEIEELVAETGCPVPCTLIIHDCCMETWFLGNRRFARRHPQSDALRSLYGFFDVRAHDPEAMPSMDTRTRAQFHHDYLRELFRERGLTYSKQRPAAVSEGSYLHELVRRAEDTGHLSSMKVLIERWRALGGKL